MMHVALFMECPSCDPRTNLNYVVLTEDTPGWWAEVENCSWAEMTYWPNSECIKCRTPMVHAGFVKEY